MLSHSDIPNKYKKFVKDIHNYRIRSQLAKRSFSEVFKIVDINTKEELVAKIIQSNKTTKEQILRELQILADFQTPTFIKFIGYSLKDFNNQNNITFFMEYAQNGSLQNMLENERISLASIDFDYAIKQIILIGTAYSMMILNNNLIIHRDLTPSNILIDKNFFPKFSDFGLSKPFKKGYEFDQSVSCGTPIYMAPENNEKLKYGIKSDVYSFGKILYEIVSGKPSFKKIENKIVDTEFIPEFDISVSKPIRKLIIKCLSKNPDERPSFEELYKKFAYDKNYLIHELTDNDYERVNDYVELITNNEIIGCNKNVSKKQDTLVTSNADIKNTNDHSNDIKKVNAQNKILNDQLQLKEKNKDIKNPNIQKNKKVNDQSQSKVTIKDVKNPSIQNNKKVNDQLQSKETIKDTKKSNIQINKKANNQLRSKETIIDIKKSNNQNNKKMNDETQSKETIKDIKNSNNQKNKNVNDQSKSKQNVKNLKQNKNKNNKNINIQSQSNLIKDSILKIKSTEQNQSIKNKGDSQFQLANKGTNANQKIELNYKNTKNIKPKCENKYSYIRKNSNGQRKKNVENTTNNEYNSYKYSTAFKENEFKPYNYHTSSNQYSKYFSPKKKPEIKYQPYLTKYENKYNYTRNNSNGNRKENIENTTKNEYGSYKYSTSLKEQEFKLSTYKISSNRYSKYFSPKETPEIKYQPCLNNNKYQNYSFNNNNDINSQNIESFMSKYTNNFSDVLQFNIHNDYFTDLPDDNSSSDNEKNGCLLI